MNILFLAFQIIFFYFDPSLFSLVLDLNIISTDFTFLVILTSPSGKTIVLLFIELRSLFNSLSSVGE